MRTFSFITLSLLTLIAVSCDSTTNTSGETGSLTVTLTDAPFPFDLVAEANVTINKIEIRDNAANGDEEDTFIVLSEEAQSYNLLELQNGVKASLVDLEIEAGNYDLLRLYVSDASVVLKDGITYDLTIPSGSQTGIKIFIDPSITVAEGLSTELLLDFDVANSFVARGNLDTPAGINGFNFKPTIRAVNVSTSGRIEGMVTDSADVALDNVQISAIQDSIVANAFTDSTGYFAIIGLTEGTYEVQATHSNYDTSIVELKVTAANSTTTDFTLVPADE